MKTKKPNQWTRGTSYTEAIDLDSDDKENFLPSSNDDSFVDDSHIKNDKEIFLPASNDESFVNDSHIKDDKNNKPEKPHVNKTTKLPPEY